MICAACLAASRMNSTACAKFLSGSGPHRICTRATREVRSDIVLLDRISWHDLDAFDHHPLGRFAVLARAASGHRHITDFSQHVIAFDQLTERGVLMIQTRNARETDEKLRSS